MCYMAVPCESVSSGICEQRRPRSACASAQPDQGIRCRQTESLDTLKCFNGEKCPDETAHVQGDVDPPILRMLEDTFLLDVARIFVNKYY